jgi:hypothetical protein
MIFLSKVQVYDTIYIVVLNSSLIAKQLSWENELLNVNKLLINKTIPKRRLLEES